MRDNNRIDGLKYLIEANKLEPNDLDTLLKLADIYLRDQKSYHNVHQLIRKALALEQGIP